jgi:tryptophan-rich sensory protein
MMRGIAERAVAADGTGDRPPQRPAGLQLCALLAFVILCFAAAAVGALLTASSVAGWYQTLAKPGWTPPDWVFGPVWSMLYLLMAIAAWLVWRRAVWSVSRAALTLFGVQLVLNVAWSGCFFGLQRPGLAFIELLVLLGAIVATMASFRRISRLAAVLMLPYLSWSTFAVVLNFGIWRLNP